MKKKINDKDMIEAWNYDSGVFKGQSIGIHNSATGEIDKLLSVECFHGGEEVKRIVINKEATKKHGFLIIVD